MLSGSQGEDKMNGKLTEEQIDNWRKALLPMLGPYALIAPAEEIQRLRDKMQDKIDKGKIK